MAKNKMQDKPATLSDMEKTEIHRLLLKATTEDVGDILSSSFLEPALTRAKQREHRELQAKEEFDKKLKKPLQKLNECIATMESIKSKIAMAEDFDLLFLAKNYEETYKKYKEAEVEVKKLDCNFSGMGYYNLPTDAGERLRWLSTMRQIWRQKRGVR